MLEMKIRAGTRYVGAAQLVHTIGAARALEKLSDMVEALIAQIDMIEGDPDLEETDAEDAFAFSSLALHFARGPGCLASDAGDIGWQEWHARNRHKVDAYGGEPMPKGPWGNIGQEDDEDDDPREEHDADSACDDYGIDEDSDREPTASHDAPFLRYGIDQSEPLEWSPANDVRAFEAHRDYIRASRCERVASSPAWNPRWRFTHPHHSVEAFPAAN